MLNSEEDRYYGDMFLLGEQLLSKGYPAQLVSQPPLYNCEKRVACLRRAFDKTRTRLVQNNNITKHSDTVVLALPFCQAFKRLRIANRLKNLIKTLGLHADAILAYSMSNSLFLKTYPQNTPIQLCRSVRG